MNVHSFLLSRVALIRVSTPLMHILRLRLIWDDATVSVTWVVLARDSQEHERSVGLALQQGSTKGNIIVRFLLCFCYLQHGPYHCCIWFACTSCRSVVLHCSLQQFSSTVRYSITACTNCASAALWKPYLMASLALVGKQYWSWPSRPSWYCGMLAPWTGLGAISNTMCFMIHIDNVLNPVPGYDYYGLKQRCPE